MNNCLILAAVYTAISLVTFIVYVIDKRAARRGQRRISEKSLHFLELAGGWPGALLAQRIIRHKNAKPSYQIVFWLIVFIHLGLWFLLWNQY